MKSRHTVVIAVDPGNERSAVVVWDGEAVLDKLHTANDFVLTYLRRRSAETVWPCVIEMIGHYGTGMPAGKTVFDTCVWIGRFMQAYGADRVETILRPTIKTHICGSARAKDANVRQALIDRFGGNEKAVGRKSQPGPLYGIKADEWQALALACTWRETNALRRIA